MSRFARFTAFACFLLVIAGGLVTSTDSGLAVPDWPLSYGTLFPPMVGGILYEHGHRLIAGAVAILTVILAIAVQRREPRQWVRRLAWGAVGLVLAQAGLGGATVLLQLPSVVSVSHACLGQTFFATLLTLAVVLQPGWKTEWPAPAGPLDADAYDRQVGLLRLAGFTTAAVFIQLLLGALMRHVGWLPHLLLTHLAWAAVTTVLIAKIARRVSKEQAGNRFLTRPAAMLGWGILLQWGIGIATLFSGAAVAIATAHVAVGAALLGSGAVLTTGLFRVTYEISGPIAEALQQEAAR